MAKKKYFSILLEDYALPGFISGSKQYFGDIKDIERFVNKFKNKYAEPDEIKSLIKAFNLYKISDKDITDIVMCENKQGIIQADFLFAKTNAYSDIQWTHKNIFGFDYKLRANFTTLNHIWLKCEDKYYRCVKASFDNLEYEPGMSETENWMPLNGNFWGYPNIICQKKIDKDILVTYNLLYEVEMVFDTLADTECDYSNFNGNANLINLCNDIFGDG